MISTILQELREVRKEIRQREGNPPLYLRRKEAQLWEEIARFFRKLKEELPCRARIKVITSVGPIWFPGEIRNLRLNGEGERFKVWLRGNYPEGVKVDYQIEFPLDDLEDIEVLKREEN